MATASVGLMVSFSILPSLMSPRSSVMFFSCAFFAVRFVTNE